MALFFYRGSERVEVEPRMDVVGTSTRAGAPPPPSATPAADDEFAAQGISLVPVPSGVRADSEGDLEAALESIEASGDVVWAGAVVIADDEQISFLSREVVVALGSDDDPSDLVARHRFEVVRRLPQSPGAFLLRSLRPASYELLERVEALRSEGEVRWCEPSLVGTVPMDAVRPSQFLWPAAWDRQLVGVDHAWTLLERAGLDPFGNPEILIAIVDQGIASDNGEAIHADFAGVVSNGSPKLASLFDFHRMRPDNDALQGSHGVGVAAVAAGRAERQRDPEPSAGIPGAAPNCRIMSLIFPRNEVDQLDMYLWAAGFDPGSSREGFPAPLERGADVFSTSIGFGAGAPISQLAADTLDYIARNGRGGRGCPTFFSAGNAGSEFTTYRPWAAHRSTFGVGATTLADDGRTEARARYSGYGPLTLCAPSHDRYPLQHDPPERYATWSCDLPGRGNAVGQPTAFTSLAGPVSPGDKEAEIAEVVGLSEGARLMIGAVGAPGSEVVVVDELDAATSRVTVRPALDHAHPQGTAVVSGPSDYRSNFGGTSSATPLCAGVAALVLSANPDLTVDDLHRILCDTAQRVDADNDDPVGQWYDAHGLPARQSGRPPVRSNWYGYGRVDAVAAVSTALGFRAVARAVPRPGGAPTIC